MAGPEAADTLSRAAVSVLRAAEPAEKVRLTHLHAAAWRAGGIASIGDTAPPDRPGRPERPELKAPREMPKRGRGGSAQNRLALLHALAHIELNAIDLAWDLVARFAAAGLPKAFFDDWVTVADDEARHFTLLEGRMNALGAAYGDLPAHDGLWQSAQATAHDLAARLAVVPMVLEARGLDVTPDTVARLRAMGDSESATILQVIHDDEITHVAAGSRWFTHVCAAQGLDPQDTWQTLVRRYFRGRLKRPFNAASRALAGLPADLYVPLADEADTPAPAVAEAEG